VSHGADPWERLELYAEFAPYGEFIVTLGPDQLPPRHY
jgi:hypothetical protein